MFVLPGFLIGVILLKPAFEFRLLSDLIIGFLSTCCIASANYVINEWLDAEFDQYHPVKKHRTVVENDMDKKIVYTCYALLTVAGLILAMPVSKIFLLTEVWLWVMGILYNVRPFRLKDIVFLDVLSESVNNAIRFLIGWFMVTSQYFPPVSIVIGYWMVGAFLMATKRYSEYLMIGDPKTAGLYRKSFQKYTDKSLLLSAFFYAMCANLFIGIFLIKYRIELILFMPLFMGLFCYYFYLSFKKDSAAQKPEKLYKEKGLMLFCLVLCLIFILFMLIRVPVLDGLQSNQLVEIHW